MLPAPMLTGRMYRGPSITKEEWREKNKIFDEKEGEWSWHAPMRRQKVSEEVS